jgi:hypothetical protein
MDHKACCQLGMEISAFRRKKNSAESVLLNLVEGEEPGVSRRPQRGATDLDCREIPTRRKAMVSVGEKQRYVIQFVLDASNTVGVCDRPDLMQTAKAVSYLDFGGSAILQHWSEGSRRIVAPEPKTAGVGDGELQALSACGDAIGKGFFMREHLRSGAVQQAHNSVANPCVVLAGETEGLAVAKQGGVSVLPVMRGNRRGLGFFARYVGGGSARTEGPKGQKNGHSEHHSRRVGA